MTEIKITPISVNNAWQGRRFKTPQYKDYETALLLMLPKMEAIQSPLGIEIVFGFSSPLSDIDNPLKPFLDIMQKKYGINDRDIFELNVKKELVKKGNEFIKYKFKELK